MRTPKIAAKRAALHAKHKADYDRARAEGILLDAKNKNIIRGKQGRGLREWAERVLSNNKVRNVGDGDPTQTQPVSENE